MLLLLLCGTLLNPVMAQGPSATVTSVNNTVCAGAVLKVGYSVSSNFAPGNQFQVELSDENGSFVESTILRTFSARKTGTVSVIVPADMSGNGFRVRLLSTNPALTGPDNGSNITINEMPAIEPIANQTYCANTMTANTPFIGNTTNYTWLNDNPSIGLAASGSGTSIPSFTVINSGSSEQLAHVRVRAVSSQGCESKAAGFRITVNPVPTISPVGPIVRCPNVLVPALTFSGTVPGTTYRWTNSNTTVGLGASGVNTVPAFVTFNPSLVSPNLAQVTVVPTSPARCVGAPLVYPIFVVTCGGGGVANGDGQRAALDAQVTVGPNPTRGTVRIVYGGTATQLVVTVLNASGTPALAPFSFTGTTATADLGSLRPGTYYVQVSEPRSGASMSRIVVKF
ncbi:hypothetical protein GCM10023184_04510 [Flaviaesturariibacter amylovorans]|uniref:T9SS type A sorting domain-containing protein n=1 Tax=Flaviaesturariibacter amylovorans TaxID=1084520 RepID=A0ABP8G8N0_9BACT